MSVVDLAAVRAKREPHWAARCKCVGCGYEWVGVGPLGLVWFDCPSCGMPKGTFMHPFGVPEGALTFVCSNCAGEVFSVYKKATAPVILCLGCGIDHAASV